MIIFFPVKEDKIYILIWCLTRIDFLNIKPFSVWHSIPDQQFTARMDVFNCVIEFLWPTVECVCIFLEWISGTINISQPVTYILIFTVYEQLTWTRFYLLKKNNKTKCVKDEIIASLPRKLRFVASKYCTSYLPAISKVCWVFDNFSLIFSKNSMFGYKCVNPHPHVSSRDEWPPDGESWGSRQLRPVGETRGDLRVGSMVLIMLWTSETEIRCHGNAWTDLPHSF